MDRTPSTGIEPFCSLTVSTPTTGAVMLVPSVLVSGAKIEERVVKRLNRGDCVISLSFISLLLPVLVVAFGWIEPYCINDEDDGGGGGVCAGTNRSGWDSGGGRNNGNNNGDITALLSFSSL